MHNDEVSSRGRTCRTAIPLLVLVFLALAMPALALDTSGTHITLCSDCHGMPPLDARGTTFRNVTSGAVKGNHQNHLPATAQPAQCSSCHGTAVSGYTFNHRSGTISMAAKIGNYSTASGRARYSRGTSLAPPTTAASLGTCSTTSCHFEKTTPQWGSAAYSATSDCSACHSTPATSGAHTRHGEYTSLFNYGNLSGCAKCHPDWATGLRFSHATSAVNAGSKINVTMSEGSYSGSGSNYLPSQSGSRSLGSCSNLYCHSNGTRTSAPFTGMSTARWDASLSCKSCHGYTKATANKAITTYAHGQHINNRGGVGRIIGCNECHSSTTGNGTSIANLALHADRNVQIKFDNSINLNSENPTYNLTATIGANGAQKAAGSAGTGNSCANLYCHSTGATGSELKYLNVAWNGAAIGCSSCHGSQAGAGYTASQFGEPNFINASTATREKFNSHSAKHIRTSADCALCHTRTVSAAFSLVSSASSLHVNRLREVTFDSAKAGATATYNAQTKRCANVYCHSDGRGTYQTVRWGQTVACGSCHRATGTTAVATFSHPTHLGSGYGPAMGSGLAACQTCHVYTTETAASHANASVDLAGNACTACHPNGLGTATWLNGQRVACTSCHAASPSIIGGVAAANKARFASAGGGHGQYAASNQCTSCHDQNKTHIDGIAGSAEKRLLLANDNGLCASCHNNASTVPTLSRQNMASHVTDKKSPTPTASLCNSCHDSHGTNNLNMVKGSFVFSPLSSPVTVAFSNMSTFVQYGPPYRGLCQVCHTSTNHFRRGVAEATGVGAHGNKDHRRCTSCHDHKGAYAFQPIGGGSCDACHGYPPAPTGFVARQNNWSSARPQIYNGGGYPGGGGAHTIAGHVKPTAKPAEGFANCAVCHGSGTAHTEVLPVLPSKITVTIDPAYRFNSGLASKYSGLLTDPQPAGSTGWTNGSGSCSNVSCHFKPSPKWSSER